MLAVSVAEMPWSSLKGLEKDLQLDKLLLMEKLYNYIFEGCLICWTIIFWQLSPQKVHVCSNI